MDNHRILIFSSAIILGIFLNLLLHFYYSFKRKNLLKDIGVGENEIIKNVDTNYYGASKIGASILYSNCDLLLSESLFIMQKSKISNLNFRIFQLYFNADDKRNYEVSFACPIKKYEVKNEFIIIKADASWIVNGEIEFTFDFTKRSADLEKIQTFLNSNNFSNSKAAANE